MLYGLALILHVSYSRNNTSQEYVIFVFVLILEIQFTLKREYTKLLFIFPLYLACQSGRYGISCAKACGQTCQGCNRFNGVCEFGCHPGWTGTFCEKRSNYAFRYFFVMWTIFCTELILFLYNHLYTILYCNDLKVWSLLKHCQDKFFLYMYEHNDMLFAVSKRIHLDPWSIFMKRNSNQTGDLFLELFCLVSCIS